MKLYKYTLLRCLHVMGMVSDNQRMVEAKKMGYSLSWSYQPNWADRLVLKAAQPGVWE